MILIGKQAEALVEVLDEHFGHEITITLYGPKDKDGLVTDIWDAAVECLDCGCVIIDGDLTIEEEEGAESEV